METIIFKSNNELNESLETSTALINISTQILDDKASIICLCGAGISTEVGLRDFRSPQGLYNVVTSTSNQINTTKARSLFESSVYLNLSTRAEHWKFIANLHKQIESLSASSTHKFFKRLAKKGKLRRVYSQNIDGLENRAGLSYVPLQDLLNESGSDCDEEELSEASEKRREYEGDVVQLHGSIQEVRCSLCPFITPWTQEHTQAFSTAKALSCPSCISKVEERVDQGKRRTSPNSYLRPNLVLYNEPSSTSNLIASIASSDLASSPTLLLVLGTSLQIPGFQLLVKEFSKSIHKNGGLCVLINLEDVSGDWDEFFDYHLKGKCEDIVARLIADWKASTPIRIKKEKRNHTSSISDSIEDDTATSVNSSLSNASRTISPELYAPDIKTPISVPSIEPFSFKFNPLLISNLKPITKRDSPSPSKRVRFSHDQLNLPNTATDTLALTSSIPPSETLLSRLTSSMRQRDLLELLSEIWEEVGDVYDEFRYSDFKISIQKESKRNEEEVGIAKQKWREAKLRGDVKNEDYDLLKVALNDSLNVK